MLELQPDTSKLIARANELGVVVGELEATLLIPTRTTLADAHRCMTARGAWRSAVADAQASIARDVGLRTP